MKPRFSDRRMFPLATMMYAAARAVPGLLASEITGVQPMGGSDGHVFPLCIHLTSTPRLSREEMLERGYDPALMPTP